MAVASPSPVKILSDLGYEIWEIENDADLRSALIEAINTLSMGNPSDQRIPILQEAVKNIQRSKFKERSVNVGKLMNRKASSAQQISPQKLLPAASDDGGDNNQTIVTGGLAKRLDNIANSLDSLRRALKQQFNLDKQVAAQSKIDEAEADKKEREGQLEKGKGKAIVGGVTKTVTKPFSGFFNTLINYFKNIVLGSALLGLVNWLKDPANEEKIKAFSQFLQDTLPALIGGIVDHIRNHWKWYAAAAGIVGLLSLGGALSGLALLGKGLLWIGGFLFSIKGAMLLVAAVFLGGGILGQRRVERLNQLREESGEIQPNVVVTDEDGGNPRMSFDPKDVGNEEEGGTWWGNFWNSVGRAWEDSVTSGGLAGPGGMFSKGGRPPLGKVALVGEKGPELFVPDQRGTIINNDNFQDMVKKINETQIDGEEPVVAFAPKLIMMSKIDTPLTSRKSDPQIIDLRNNVQQQAANAVEGGSSVPSFSSKSGASEFVAASTLNIGNV